VKPARRALFVTIAAITAFSLVAVAQQPKKPAAAPKPAVAPKPAAAPTGRKKPGADASAEGVEPAPMATKEERPQPTGGSAKDGGAVVESKTLDGGGKVFRFGEVEVEGRLKSPQIVYFLRRVRAEFAAGDLGHRTFMRELSETRNEPGF
jgi:hypothetical protein